MSIACEHWETEFWYGVDQPVLVCIECKADLPVDWHDLDEDEKALTGGASS